MNDTTLFLVLGGAALFFLNKKKGGTANSGAGSPTVQTNPASRNPNQGVGNSPNSVNTQVSNAASAVTNGINAVTGAVKSIAGLGKGSTPGATVGVATSSTPSSGSGNDSFDAQDEIEYMSGSDHGEYSDAFMGDAETYTDVPATADA